MDCLLNGVSFDEAIVTAATFTETPPGTSGLTIDQIKSTWNYKNRQMEGVTLPMSWLGIKWNPNSGT